MLLREKPLWSGGPGLLELENRNGQEKQAMQQTYEMDLTPPGKKTAKQPRNWLERWWSPDPRKAPRTLAPGLAAYYWNGAAPMAHGIRDISSSGALCSHRGALVSGNPGSDDVAADRLRRRSCGAHDCRAVPGRAMGPRWRWTAVYSLRRRGPRRGKTAMLTSGRKEFRRFLEQLKRGK